MAKQSEKGPFRPTRGTARTTSAVGYMSVSRTRGEAVKQSDGAPKRTGKAA